MQNRSSNSRSAEFQSNRCCIHRLSVIWRRSRGNSWVATVYGRWRRISLQRVKFRSSPVRGRTAACSRSTRRRSVARPASYSSQSRSVVSVRVRATLRLTALCRALEQRERDANRRLWRRQLRVLTRPASDAPGWRRDESVWLAVGSAAAVVVTALFGDWWRGETETGAVDVWLMSTAACVLSDPLTKLSSPTTENTLGSCISKRDWWFQHWFSLDSAVRGLF